MALEETVYGYSVLFLLFALPAYFVYEVGLLWRALFSGKMGSEPHGPVFIYSVIAFMMLSHVVLASFFPSLLLFKHVNFDQFVAQEGVLFLGDPILVGHALVWILAFSIGALVGYAAPGGSIEEVPAAILFPPGRRFGFVIPFGGIKGVSSLFGFVTLRCGTFHRALRHFMRMTILIAFFVLVLSALAISWSFHVLLFGVGFVSEGFLIVFGRLSSRRDVRNFVSCIGVSMLSAGVATVFGWGSQVALVYACISFLLFFAVYFMKSCLPVINGSVLLVYVLLLWYVFLGLENAPSYAQLVYVFLIAATAATSYFSISQRSIGYKSKLFLYLLFLVTLLFLACLRGSFQPFMLFSERFPYKVVEIEPLSIFLSGMFFFYFAFYLFAFLQVFPMGTKDADAETVRLEVERIRMHERMLISHFSGSRLYAKISILLILVFAMGFYANSQLMVLPDSVLIHLIVLFAPTLLGKPGQSACYDVTTLKSV